ncbi:MAG TPA: PEGA domain-containing protein, partial [Kofleriaceae bacterium]|nr:PEGA domain-containing protein [Kofleriaceae bacterium]
MTVRVACLALVLQMAAAAHADPGNAGASVHLERGIAAYRARAFDRAMDELLEANRQAPDLVEPYRWIARTEAEIDDCQSALINIESFLSRVPGNDPRVPELVAVRERCQRTGRLTVESTPSGAAIRVDQGPVVATTPVSRLAMRVGRHTITVEKPGFEPMSREVDVHALAAERAGFALATVHAAPVTQRWWFWVGVGAAIVALT